MLVKNNNIMIDQAPFHFSSVGNPSYKMKKIAIDHVNNNNNNNKLFNVSCILAWHNVPSVANWGDLKWK